MVLLPNTRSRDRSLSLMKSLQRIIGRQRVTSKNAAVALLSIQFAILVFLIRTIHSNNITIHRLRSADTAFSSSFTDCRNVREDFYGLPPPENNKIMQKAIDEATYDDAAPEITGMMEIRKSTSFLGYFMRCKPQPCNIDHWAYLGDKCFFRDNHVKDKQGHNSTVWALIQKGIFYSLDNDFPCPVEICRRQWDQERDLTRRITLRTLLEHYKNDTPWNMEDMYLGNAYTRVNPFWGLEYKFHGSFKLTKTDDNGEEHITSKTAAITIRRGFTGKFCDVTLNDDVPPPTEPVYIIVPYTGRLEQLRIFYQNIRDMLDDGVNLKLILATHGGAVDVLGASELLREMQIGLVEGELSDGHIVQVIEARGDRNDKFSRAVALIDGLEYAPADALVFYCDVDMTIKKQFFDNCRYNAHRNYQVYYPVVYSLYSYGNRISKEHGYWRKGAFGMVCGYKSDFRRNAEWKKFAKRLVGWGLEDVFFYRGFNNHRQISVFHAIEPNLMHRWHPKYCQFNMNIAACLGTIFQNMGSQQFLASIVATQGVDVRSIEYNPAPVTFEGYRNSSKLITTDDELAVPVAEGITDATKLEDLRKMYEKAIQNGQGGLLSIFAKEAQEALTSSAVSPLQHAIPHLASGVTQMQPQGGMSGQFAQSPIQMLQQGVGIRVTRQADISGQILWPPQSVPGAPQPIPFPGDPKAPNESGGERPASLPEPPVGQVGST